MDNPLVRTILAVIAGVIVGAAIVFVTEATGHSLFPPPADLDLSKPEDLKRLIDNLPFGAFAMVLLGWFLGSFAGAYVAHAIAKSPVAVWAVAAIFILFTSMNFVKIPHPMWMIAAGLLIPVVSAWLVLRLRGSTGAA